MKDTKGMLGEVFAELMKEQQPQTAATGFLRFTESETAELPTDMRELMLGGAAHVIKSGTPANFLYTVTLRRNGHYILASGKTLTEAKENFIRNAKEAII